MKLSTDLILLLAIALASCVAQNDVDEILYMMRSVVDGLNETRLQLQEMKAELQTLKVDQCAEYQQCAKQSQIVNIEEACEMAQKEIVKSTSNQLNYILNLLATDECLGDKHNCSEMAICNDQFVNYTCTCRPGYFGDGFNCQDIDECSEEAQLCGANSLCANIPGSYTCNCVEGYKRNGNKCTDIDECTEEAQLCGANSICANIPGSYTCTCEEGYKKNGNNCTDVDECEERNLCHERASCVNIPGNYTCHCLAPYLGDGSRCKVSCESPSLLHDELGCITPISERLTWEAAKTKCQASGQRLLEEVREAHFESLSQHLQPMKFGDMWIGFRDYTWTSSGRALNRTGSHWHDGFPMSSSSKNCGGLAVNPPTLGMFNERCSWNTHALCQLALSNDGNE